MPVSRTLFASIFLSKVARSNCVSLSLSCSTPDVILRGTPRSEEAVRGLYGLP